MNDIMVVCGGVLGVVLVGAALKSYSSGWSMIVSTCLGLFVLRRAVGIMEPVILYVNGLLGGSEYSEYLSCALKALGIACVTHITCETCRDLGEGSLAAKVELCGKAAILLCSVPVVKQIFSCVYSFLQ